MIVAFLDATASARPVLEMAIRLAELLDLGVVAVHVEAAEPPSPATPTELAASRGVDLRTVPGPVAETVLEEAGRPGVEAVVMGARTTEAGRRPVGSTTRHVIQRCPRPVLIVPPEAIDSRPLRTALVPLDGTAQASSALDAWIPRLAGQMALIGLHVFTMGTSPPMLDRPVRDMLMLADEFQERHLPGADRVEMRSGHVAARIIELSGERGADLVVLSWSQSGAPGRAQTVLEVLSLSQIPTFLLPPVAAAPGPPDDGDQLPADSGRERSEPAPTREW
ncbi:MAG TPA: universal stress protein [Acidimicrobiales bacterium]|nr:universal stress protein [Acidimicrobiales bacterium]